MHQAGEKSTLINFMGGLGDVIPMRKHRLQPMLCAGLANGMLQTEQSDFVESVRCIKGI